MPIAATLIVVALYVLHQDFWFWRDARPLVFGALPIGLFYHAAYTTALSLVFWGLVTFLWPSYLGTGHAFANGIVTFGSMASSSALIVPLTLFLIGTRLWSLGKEHGFMTPVQMFRDRWECSHIGTVISAVQAVLLVPYIAIAVIGGGTTLRTVSGGLVPYWLGEPSCRSW